MDYLTDSVAEIDAWFTSYVHSFYSDEDKELQEATVMKEEHTAYVRSLCRELAEHLKLNEHDVLLAEIMGILHDVGRFSQFVKYRTFVDALSEDHASIGIQVFSKEAFFQKLAKEDRDIILFAVDRHNKKEINAECDERTLFFAKLLRDADKVDIYRVLSPFLTPAGEEGVSPLFAENFVKALQCDYTAVRTIEDKKLVRLMWVYDMNFAWSVKKVTQMGYIERIYDNLPHTAEIELGMQKLRAYVKERLAET